MIFSLTPRVAAVECQMVGKNQTGIIKKGHPECPNRNETPMLLLEINSGLSALLSNKVNARRRAHYQKNKGQINVKRREMYAQENENGEYVGMFISESSAEAATFTIEYSLPVLVALLALYFLIKDYSILIKPSVNGPKFLRATGSLENEIIVVVLP